VGGERASKRWAAKRSGSAKPRRSRWTSEVGTRTPAPPGSSRSPTRIGASSFRSAPEEGSLGADLDAAAVPTLPSALELAASGRAEAGGSRRDAEDAGRYTTWGAGVPRERRVLLTDAMTSGGLLAAVPPGAEMTGSKIGTLVVGEPRIAVS
jgi:hypothetical protein